MKKVLITSFDMEVGGVERSLISMLNNFDYEKYCVDLMLYSHTGDFMDLLPKENINLIAQNKKYATCRKSIKEVFCDGEVSIAYTRLLSRIQANVIGRIKNKEVGCYQMQLMWKYALPFLPRIATEYDVAISYLWPHYFVADKVKAKTKIAWIHTDYSTIYTDVNMDLKMWNKFDYIISISEECTNSFLSKYPSLKKKIILVENLVSIKFIKQMSNERIKENVFNNKHFNILSVARFSHAKGIDNAVKALKLIHDRGFNNIKWYVIGYGGDESLIRNLIKENNLENDFILLGKKTNPYPYMRACDLYVQPSRYEGKAVTVKEAQILGKPVMITNYTTAKSQLIDGIDGYITELSIDGIASGIEKLYRDNEFRNKLAYNCKNSNYENYRELNKLYKIF